MGFIEKVLEIPKFISLYIDKGYIQKELVDLFVQQLLENEYKSTANYDNTITLKFDLFNKGFVDFYLDKSRLDREFKCIYEDDLDIGQSIMNEVFIVSIYKLKYYIYIDDIVDNTIIMKTINMIEYNKKEGA